MGRLVDGSTLDDLSALNDEANLSVRWVTDPDGMRQFGDLTVRATEAIVADPRQAADDYVWYRFDWDEIQPRRTGSPSTPPEPVR
jgi:hypothetical protein